MPRILAISAAVLALAFLVGGQSAAQSDSPGAEAAAERALESLTFSRLAVAGGQPDDTVAAVLQDDSGFLWVGTQSGLFRFDAYKFTTVHGDDAVTALVLGPKGRIWAGTADAGLLALDPLTERLERHRYEGDDPSDAEPGTCFASPAANRITALVEDDAGRLWMGTEGSGLAVLDPRSLECVAFDLGEGDASPVRISALAQNGGERLWVATFGRGLFALDGDGQILEHHRHVPGDPESLSSDLVHSLHLGVGGALWAGTSDGVLHRHDPGTTGFERSLLEDAHPIYTIDAAGDEALWLGTHGGGLHLFDLETRRSQKHYRRRPSDPTSLGHNFLIELFEDRSGTLWIGTDSGGLLSANPKRDRFRYHRVDLFDPNTLSHPTVWALREDPGGSLWIGTSGGLDRYHRERDTYEAVPLDPGRGASDDSVVWALAGPEPGGRSIWAGTLSRGLVAYDPVTGRRRTFRHDPADPTSLASNRVRTLLRARHGAAAGRLWIGTQGSGLDLYDPAEGTFRHFPAEPEGSRGLADGIVVALAEDEDGILWAATRDTLHRVDPATGTVERHPLREDFGQDGGRDQMRSLHADTEGRLWVGTDRGLHHFDDGSFITVSNRDSGEQDGPAGGAVTCILEDAQGRLWMSTDEGISRYDPRGDAWRNFDVGDGLQGNDLQTGGCFANREGEMFFGGMVGFHEFHPRSLGDNPYRPPVAITSFKIFDHPVPFQVAAAYGEPLRLSHQDNTVSFSFAALDTTHPERNRYSYRLEGRDVAWSEPGRQRKVTFRNLVPGRYTFRVRGSNNDKVWNEGGAAVSFEIVPPPWRAWWAYVGYGVAGVALLALFFHVQLLRVQRQTEDRRKTLELEQARSLQLAMLPAAPPEIPGLDIAVYMRTATEVGGDYYDFFPQEDGSLVVAVGDATGHGISAGMMVSMTKVALQALEVAAPDRILARLSEILAAIHRGGPRMALSLTQVTRREVRFSAAAMPPALIYRGASAEEGARVDEILLPALPLGGKLDPGYRLQGVPFAPGDALVLISDGLPERRNAAGEVLGYRMLQEALEEHGDGSAREILRRLVNLGESWGSDRPTDDDVTLVVIRNRLEASEDTP